MNPLARLGASPGGLGAAIASTTVINMVVLLSTMVTGIFVARSLGEVGRGQYATVVAWFGLALVIGEFGQSAAVTFRVARDRLQTATIVATSRYLMVPLGLVITAVGVGFTPWLSDGVTAVRDAYFIAFAAVLVNTIFGPYLYALQALELTRWNKVRALQPLTNLIAVLLLFATHHLTIVTASAALLISVTVSMGIAVFATRGRGALGGGFSRVEAGYLTEFGYKQAFSAIPAAVSTNADRLVLGKTVPPGDVGQYAVAQSVIAVAGPVATAISSVVFPRLAASAALDNDRVRQEKLIIGGSAIAVTVVAVGLATISRWAIPVVFGRQFGPAIALSWWIVPAVWTRSMLIVVGTVLRGRGAPGGASIAETTGLVLSLSSMVVLIPPFGVVGAPLALAVGQAAGLLVALFVLRRARPTKSQLTFYEDP